MDAQPDHQQRGHEVHVQDVEAKQGGAAHVAASEQHLPNPVTHHGHVAGDVRPDGDRPVGQLVPGEQVAREGEEQRAQQ